MGLFEIAQPICLDEEATIKIKNHLNLVFAHSIDSPDPTGKFQDIHDGVVSEQFPPPQYLPQSVAFPPGFVRPQAGPYRC